MKRIIVLTLFICFLAACSNTENEQKTDTLVIADWGGAITDARQETIIKPFEEKYDVKVEIETPTDYGKLKAMVEGGNVTWDVANVATYWAEQAGAQGLMEEIDYDIVETEGIVEELVTTYGVGAEMYSAVIAYSTEAFDEASAPETWEDFWNVEKFPGTRAFYNSPIQTLESALLADGVPAESLYPLDVDRAFEKLDELRDKVEIIWWDAGAQPAELLSTGSATIASAWNGRITVAQQDGAPIELTYNQAILNSEGWSVPKGAKNKDLAMKFIDFATDIEPQAAFAQEIDYSPTNQLAIESLPQEVQDRLGQSPKLAENQIIMDTAYWAEHYEELAERLQEWLLESE